MIDTILFNGRITTLDPGKSFPHRGGDRGWCVRRRRWREYQLKSTR
jgi:hypothetical protein